jgi:HSP20 family protein
MMNELRRRQTQALREREGHELAGVYPAVNIYDDGDSFMIRAELPGIDKTKLDITTKGNRVSIRGERTCAQSSEEVAFHRRERDMGFFRRVVNLPEHVDPTKTTASYKNGVLEVTCPRAESAKAHRVEIA